MHNALADDERLTPASRPLPLVGFIAILAASGTFLAAIAGPPQPPARIPSGSEILLTLQGTDPPLTWLAYVFVTAAWIVWTWLAASLVLQLLSGVIELVTRGATWARWLRHALDRVTAPITRRVVDGALVTVVVVNLVARAPTASAAPLDPPVTIARTIAWHGSDLPINRGVHAPNTPPKEIAYAVKPGDNLWEIAEHFYGTGEEYPRLVEANAGRRMPDGNVFTRQGVIRPGWVLQIPLPSTAVQTEKGQTYYVVQDGDTLRGIAARFLGDENRWPAIFEQNQGRAQLVDGRTLTNPDLIWPGLRLRLPVAEPVPGTAPSAPARHESPAPLTDHFLPPSPVGSHSVQPNALPTTELAPAASAPLATHTALTVPAAVESSPTTRSALPFSSPLVDGAAAGVVVAAGAAILARRRFRRSLDEPSDASTPSPLTLCNDFTAAELARSLAHRLESGEVEPVEVVAAQTLRFLRERGIDDAAILFARHAPKATSLVVEMDLPSETELAELAADLGSRLGGHGRATITSERDVALKLNDLKLTTVALPMPNGTYRHPLLIPVGVVAGGEAIHLSWTELGHVLIAAQPGGGGNVVLTTILAGLAARRKPSELRLITIARSPGLPSPIARLPHQAVEVVDLDDDAAVAQTLQTVRAELLHRMAGDEGVGGWRPTPEQPPIVVAIEEIADVEDDGTTLELLGSRGRAHGIVLLAATAHADEVVDDLLVHFPTRLVLQTLDDADSIRLLGRPDAVDLGSAEILVRVAGRAPLRVRGFRISDDHLERLVSMLRDAYGETRSVPTIPHVADQARQSKNDEQASPALRDQPESDCVTETLSVAAEHLVAAEMPDESESAEEPSDADHNHDGHLVGVVSLNGTQIHVNGENGHFAAVTIGAVETPLDIAASEGAAFAATRVKPDRAPEALGNGSTLNVRTPSGAEEDTEGDAPNDDVADRRHPIQVRCFGRFLVTSGGHELTPTLNGRSCHKAWELLALLASRPDGAMPKDQILAALWPDTDEEYAMQNLHQSGSRLRRCLRAQVPDVDDSVVSSGRDGIYRLDPAQIWSDAQRFASLCNTAPKLPTERAIAALHQGRRLYRGELLADQSFKWPTDRYAGIILRTHYADLYRQATCRMARLLCESGHPARAIPLYKGLLKQEPTLEDVVRGLYRCYEQLGDLGSLIREDQELRQALREEFGDKHIDKGACEPSAPTRELFRQIRSRLEERARAAKNGHAPVLTARGIQAC
jgi:two-component SAPR family response regulator/LysM repeat protein